MKSQFLTAALAVLAMSAPSAAQSILDPGPIAAPGKIKREPTLIYDVSGSTLTGPVHTNLVVYNDGFVTYSNFSSFGSTNVAVTTKFVPETVVKALTFDLQAAGAHTLSDSGGIVFDLPTTTVTFMRPGTNAKARTFSFNLAGDGHIAVIKVISTFLNQFVFNSSSISLTSALSIPVISGFPIKQEPVLMYNVTGGSLGGPIHRSMVVYNNGVVSVATDTAFLGNETIEAYSTFVDPSIVRALSSDLAAAGAGSLLDNPAIVLDVPLTTVTYFRGTTNAKAHTFSYLGGGQGYSNVTSIISTFEQDHVSNPYGGTTF